MALIEAIKDTLQDMDDWESKITDQIPITEIKTRIRSYIREINIALKAGEPHVLDFKSPTPGAVNQGAIEEIRRALIDAEKTNLQRSAQAVIQQEQTSGDIVDVIGGKANPDNIPTVVSIDSRMPVGAKTILNGDVYVLGEDRKLHFCPEETKKVYSKNPLVDSQWSQK